MSNPVVMDTPEGDKRFGEAEVTVEFYKGNMVNVERLTLEQAKALHQSLIAYLDGAPEPEWEYGYRGRYAVMHPTKAGQRIETPEITQRTPDNWLPEMGEIYRRRPSLPAGPWLPVEGESKP